MRSAATAANAGAAADHPLLRWGGTITGDLRLTHGDPAAAAMSATVTGGATAPLELSLGQKHLAVGDVAVAADLHVQYGPAAAPMFAADATLRFVVGAAAGMCTISGSGNLTFRIPLDGDGVAAVSMSAALQIFPKGVPHAIKRGRSVALSGAGRRMAPVLHTSLNPYVCAPIPRLLRYVSFREVASTVSVSGSTRRPPTRRRRRRRSPSAGTPCRACASPRMRTRSPTAWLTTRRR